jgi:5-methylcytosine-specific restriction protein A
MCENCAKTAVKNRMSGDYTAEIVFGGLVAAWVLYELYGKGALEWLTQWTMYIRIGGGIAILGYLYWQARSAPETFQDTLDLAKEMLTSSAATGGYATGATREKRNVSNLMKKKVAASQGWKCGKCGELLDETYEVDHKVALYKGGSNDMSNLVGLCPHCHRAKTVEERLQD